jgi:hypothetical protein
MSAYANLLSALVGQDVEVENGPDQGFGGPIIEVGWEGPRLYVDVDWGYRFYIDETQPLFIQASADPQPVGEWCRETHPHLFEKHEEIERV